MKATKGNVINVSATLQYNGTPMQVHACSAKAGVDAMTKVLAIEWGQYGIRINVIAPGVRIIRVNLIILSRLQGL